MKIHIRKRKLTGKSHSKAGYSLYLDIYNRKGNRKREFLGIYFEPNDTKTARDDKQKSIADTIIDRIVHDAHRIELKGESLRKTRKRQKPM